MCNAYAFTKISLNKKIIGLNLKHPHPVQTHSKNTFTIDHVHQLLFTGETLRQLTDPKVRPKSSNVFDLCEEGDTMMIPRFHEQSVLVYKLLHDK